MYRILSSQETKKCAKLAELPWCSEVWAERDVSRNNEQIVTLQSNLSRQGHLRGTTCHSTSWMSSIALIYVLLWGKKKMTWDHQNNIYSDCTTKCNSSKWRPEAVKLQKRKKNKKKKILMGVYTIHLVTSCVFTDRIAIWSWTDYVNTLQDIFE